MDSNEILLISALRCPPITRAFHAAQWDQCMRQARQTKLLGRLCVLLEQEQIFTDLPSTVRHHLNAARTVAEQQERSLRWEVNRLERALVPLGFPILLLKGGGYAMAGLPPASGRLYSDVDIMVHKNNLLAAESALLQNGWEAADLDKYDQRYYRMWMHELPPMQHRERRTIVDLHHNILPETGRLHPDAQLLIESARTVPETAFKVLAPADMVLHSAGHMFQDGEIAGSLRDLTDLDDLLRHFEGYEGFWEGLIPRAELLHLTRPLFYALRYARLFFGTPIPLRVILAAGYYGPNNATLSLMDFLVHRSLPPTIVGSNSWRTKCARTLLYIRSHWLRMPPFLLARHLLRKSARRWLTHGIRATAE